MNRKIFPYIAVTIIFTAGALHAGVRMAYESNGSTHNVLRWNADPQEEVENVVLECEPWSGKNSDPRAAVDKSKLTVGALVTNKSIYFYNAIGYLVNKKDRDGLENVVISKNNKYIGVNVSSLGKKSVKPYFELMDLQGQIKFTAKNVLTNFVEPSPSGDFAVGLGDADSISYYDSTGNVSMLVFDETRPYRGIHTIFSDNGPFWAAAGTVTEGTIRKDIIKVNFYENNKPAWQKQVAEWTIGDDLQSALNVSDIAISKSCKKIAVLYSKLHNTGETEEFIAILDNNGERLAKVQLESGNYRIGFNDNEDKLFAAGIQTKAIYCISAADGDVLWNVYNKINDDMGAVDIKTAPNDYLAVVARNVSFYAKNKNDDTLLQVYDDKGGKVKNETMLHKNLLLQKIYPRDPIIAVSRDCGEIYIVTKEGIEKY